MKVISKDEEQAHYNEVLKGGFIGGAGGLALGALAVVGASQRYPAFRSLTLPFRAFMITSAATFGAITSADRASTRFAKAQDPMNFYKDESTRAAEAEKARETTAQKLTAWARENRYTIVLGSWAASMAIAGILVGRNKYLTTAQKVVQARVYAQGLTLAVLVASAVLETGDARSGTGRWETVMVLDPNDPEHKHMIEKKIHHEEYEGQDLWQDMVAAEEKRLESQHKDVHTNKKKKPTDKAEDVSVEKAVDESKGKTGDAKAKPDDSGDKSKDKAADTKDEPKDDAKDDSKDQSADANGTQGKSTNAKDNIPTDVKPKNPEAAKNPKKNEVTKHIAPVKSQGI